MKRLAVFAFAAALIFPVTAQAQPCFGAPADYIAAFDAKDGAVDGRVSYPEPRMYLEVQGWVTPANVAPGHRSEHIHSGTCFPQGETLTLLRLDYKHVAFNVSGYAVTDVRGGFVEGGNGLLETSAQRQELTAMLNASSGGKTATVFQSYAIGKATSNGRKEFRTGLNLVRSSSAALVDRWFTSTGWQTYFNFAGLPTRSPVRGSDVVIARNWITGKDYGNIAGGVHRASTAGAVRTGVWRVNWNPASGVNRGDLSVDPDFHADSLGIWSKALSGTSTIAVDVPVDTFPNGQHRLVWRGHEGASSSVVSTVVQVIPFLS